MRVRPRRARCAVGFACASPGVRAAQAGGLGGRDRGRAGGEGVWFRFWAGSPRPRPFRCTATPTRSNPNWSRSPTPRPSTATRSSTATPTRAGRPPGSLRTTCPRTPPGAAWNARHRSACRSGASTCAAHPTARGWHGASRSIPCRPAATRRRTRPAHLPGRSSHTSTAGGPQLPWVDEHVLQGVQRSGGLTRPHLGRVRGDPRAGRRRRRPHAEEAHEVPSLLPAHKCGPSALTDSRRRSGAGPPPWP